MATEYKRCETVNDGITSQNVTVHHNGVTVVSVVLFNINGNAICAIGQFFRDAEGKSREPVVF